MRFLPRLILVLNFLAVLVLLLATSAQWINPQRTWLPAFLGLGFPIVVLINLSFVLFWIIARKRWWMVSAIAVLLLLVAGTRYFAFRPFATNNLDEGYRILSFNVQNFDLYNWSHNTESRDSIIALIKRQSPDIVCFQEFYQEDDGFLTAEQLGRDLQLPHHHFAKTFSLLGKDHWGLATFSRYPIHDVEFTAFEGTKLNGMLRTDITLDSGTVRVFNVHLQSIRFSNDEFENLDKDYAGSSRRIAGKIRYGFRKRADQSILVADAVDASPHPVIVCGDFNDTPVSFTYRTVSSGLQDAFMKKGVGIGKTYAGSLPGLRIDYILMSRSLKINGVKRLRKKLSDHYPVIASFSLGTDR